MKFHLKMTFSMLALLSLLFGIGGSMLISASFLDSLEREKTAAFGDYRMAWGMLQIVNGLDPFLDQDTIVRTMEQLYQQNGASWTSLRLSDSRRVLYEEGTIPSSLPRTDGDMENPIPGDCLFRILDGQAGECYLVLSGAVETNSDVLRLTTSHDITAIYTARSAQQHTYLRVFLVMCLLCGALSYTISRILTNPLKDLSRASRAIASGDYTSRVRIQSRDEVGMLSEDFNVMAEQLERHILELRQSVERQELTLTAVSPGALVEELARRLEPIYSAKGIRITCDCEAGLCLIEPDLVWSLLLNLADNAQKAMDEGGELRFRLRMLEDGCRICVLDSGRGIPPQELEHLTEAFYRVDKARSRRQGGFGLGLALCKEIVSLHKGSLRFERRVEGGTCVTVELRGGRP